MVEANKVMAGTGRAAEVIVEKREEGGGVSVLVATRGRGHPFFYSLFLDARSILYPV